MANDGTTPVSTPPIVPGKPTASNVLQSMKDGETALDFIRNNLRPSEPQSDLNPTEIIKQVEATKQIEAKKEVNGFDLNPQPKVELKPETPKAPIEEPKVDAPKVELKDEDFLKDDIEIDPQVENFKRLRKITRAKAEREKELETELEAAKEKVTKFETGEVIPDVVKNQEQEILRLRGYEKLVSLKTSPEYKEKFIEPYNKVQTKLTEIAADYEVPPEVLNEALNITNKRELDGFLNDHFGDLGALEVKDLLKQAKDIQVQAYEAEKEPARALQAMQEDHVKITQVRDQARKGRIAELARDSWVDSLLDIKQENLAVELIPKETDPEYNEKFVYPILTQASSEFGKLMTMLAECGLQDPPKELTKALARMTQLAHASGVAIHSRAAALKHAEDIEKNVERSSSYDRPQIGTTSHGHGGVAPSGPASPQAAADVLLDRVMSGKK